MAKAGSLQKFKSKQTRGQKVMMSLMAAFMALMILSWIPTQLFAHAFGYQRALGEPYWRGATFAIYDPFSWFEWAMRFIEHPVARPFVETMTLQGYGVVAAALVVGFETLRRMMRPVEGKEDLHGSAHWAEFKHIDETGFMNSYGKRHPVLRWGLILLGTVCLLVGVVFAVRKML